jgi:hypothetical protein
MKEVITITNVNTPKQFNDMIHDHSNGLSELMIDATTELMTNISNIDSSLVGDDYTKELERIRFNQVKSLRKILSTKYSVTNKTNKRVFIVPNISLYNNNIQFITFHLRVMMNKYNKNSNSVINESVTK